VGGLAAAYGCGRRPRGCRRDGGGQGSCLHSSESVSAVGGPGCWALSLHVRFIGCGSGKARRVGPSGDRGAIGRRWERLAGGQWVRCTADLNPERAGGGEHKKARSCRDGMTLC
jgi:hypothetical protein